MPISECGFQLRAGTQRCRGPFLTAYFAVQRPTYAGGGGEQFPESFLHVCSLRERQPVVSDVLVFPLCASELEQPDKLSYLPPYPYQRGLDVVPDELRRHVPCAYPLNAL